MESFHIVLYYIYEQYPLSIRTNFQLYQTTSFTNAKKVGLLRLMVQPTSPSLPQKRHHYYGVC